MLLTSSLGIINFLSQMECLFFCQNEYFVFLAPFYELMYLRKCAQGHSLNIFRITIYRFQALVAN